MRSQALAIARSGTSQTIVAAAVEADARAHLDADRIVDADADPPHDREQLLTGAEARAAARQIATARSNTVTSQPMVRSRFAANNPLSDPPITRARGRVHRVSARSMPVDHDASAGSSDAIIPA